jgi:hypothetical protein
MTRSAIVLALLVSVVALPLPAQRRAPQYASVSAEKPATIMSGAGSRGLFRGTLVHYGKWLTAAGAVALTYLAAEEHQQSRREWNSLLAICRSARDACVLGPNGAYQRGDAEALYQISRRHDKKANEWLFAAQAALFTTTALFIIDLHPRGQGPDNIPYPAELRLGGVGGGTGVELRVAF